MKLNACYSRYFSKGASSPRLTYIGVTSNAKGTTCKFNAKSGHEFYADEPKEIGGQNLGPNPIIYLSAALTACEQVIMASISKERDIPIGNIKWDTKFGLDVRGLKGIEGAIVQPQTADIKAEIEIESKNVSKLEEICAEVEKRCPVYNLCKNAGVKINATYTPKVVDQL